MGAIFFHRAAKNAFEIRRERGIQTQRRYRLLVQNRIQCGDDVAGGEGLFAGSHFVEHNTQRKQIAARIQHFAASLLGRHVNRRSRNHADRGERVF